jgi:hypothetical protein
MNVAERLYIAAKHAPEDIDTYYYSVYLEQAEMFGLTEGRLFSFFAGAK